MSSRNRYPSYYIGPNGTPIEWKKPTTREKSPSRSVGFTDRLFLLWLAPKLEEFGFTNFRINMIDNAPYVSYEIMGNTEVQPLSKLYETYGTEYENELKKGGYKSHIKRNHRKSHKNIYRKRHINRTRKHHK